MPQFERAMPDTLDKYLSDYPGTILQFITGTTVSIKDEWGKELGTSVSDDI